MYIGIPHKGLCASDSSNLDMQWHYYRKSKKGCDRVYSAW